VYVEQRDGIKHIMPIGSLLDDAYLDNSVVWGCGFGQVGSMATRPLEIRAIRGKLSRAKYINSGIKCPEVYGDPAILLPRYYPVEVEKEYNIGIVPHIIDYAKVFEWYAQEPAVIVIDLRRNIEEIIQTINKCKKIVSSSLHGVVVGQAYKVPSLWVEFSDNVIGSGFKFRDYFSVFNVERNPINVREKQELSVITKECFVPRITETILNNLQQSFPEII
jgi:pyruvyltransferase